MAMAMVSLCPCVCCCNCSALNMLLPLPRYLAAARDIESLPPGEGTIINAGPLALRKVGQQQALHVLPARQCTFLITMPCRLWLCSILYALRV